MATTAGGWSSNTVDDSTADDSTVVRSTVSGDNGPRVMLLGSTGQVGRAIASAFGDFGTLIPVGRNEADLSDLNSLRHIIARLSPDIVINAAAYTNTEKAEDEAQLAMRVNAEAPGVLADEMYSRGGVLVHYSTDYVFDGEKSTPYTEEDEGNPLSVYGRSKLAGDIAIAGTPCRHLIFRTSWVYSHTGDNFVRKMLSAATQREELRVVADQFGAPTSADSIAAATIDVLKTLAASGDAGDAGDAGDTGRAGDAGDRWGLYNLSARGATTWFGFASRVIERGLARGLNFKVTPERVVPVESSAFPSSIKRPTNSLLANDRLRLSFGMTLPDWTVEVDRTVDLIVNKGLSK